MRSARNVTAAAAVGAVLVLAIAWSLGQRPNPVSAPPSASPATASSTPTPSATPSSSATPTSAASSSTTTVQTGTITGQLGYPSEFVPPLTVYAISVTDPSAWYSTNTPFLGNFTRPTPSPTPSFAATWPPTGDGRYQLTLPAGTYYVIAYSNDTGLPNLPAAYTRYTIDCIQKTGPNSPPPACSGNDHTFVPVTVQAGQTASGIDIKDWQVPGVTYPPRPAPR